MSTLFLEAFGQMSGPAIIDSLEEDLHSVFRERAELMGWSTTSNDRPLLWAMEEAEITADTDPYRIGWVQVGLGVGPVEVHSTQPAPLSGPPAPSVRPRSTKPVLVLPALVQCFNDSLSRFGVVELSGLQVTAGGPETSTGSCLSYLVAVLNWFNTDSKARADAIVAFDQELLGGHTEAELVAGLQRRNTGSFEFGPVVAVPEQHMVKVPVETPFHHPVAPQSDLGVFVTLPEWTPSAAGWVLASVVDAARTGAPDVSDFAIRVTRVR